MRLLLVVVWLLWGCATWEDGARRGLLAAHEAGKIARQMAEEACQIAIAGCAKDEPGSPCPALTKCQLQRERIIPLLTTAQRSIWLGFSAVELQRQGDATKRLAEAYQLVDQAQSLLSDLMKDAQ